MGMARARRKEALPPMNFAGFILTQCLNALSQASLLFFIACGLTLIFGIMRIINFAHGAIYMLGAYVGYTISIVTGSFWLALLVAPVVVAAVGALFERFLLSRLYERRDRALSQFMVVYGEIEQARRRPVRQVHILALPLR